MEFTSQDSDSDIFNMKVQQLRESVALLRRQFNQERKTSIQNQRLMRSGYTKCTRCTPSTNVLQRRVSTIQSKLHNPYNIPSTDFLQKCEPRSAPKQYALNMPSIGEAMRSRPRPSPRAWNIESLHSKPLMARLKAPGPYETQVLNEINRPKPRGCPRPSPAKMYCEVSKIRNQRIQFFKEQLEKIDNSCNQELKRIELSKCRLTPLLKESSAWRSSVFANSSEICIPVSTKNVSQSQCTDMIRPRTAGMPVTFNIFEPIVNCQQSNGSGSSNTGRWYKTDVYNKTSRARVSANFGDRPTQYYDRQVLTQSSQVNTISYRANSDKCRFEASKEPNQKHNKSAISELYPPNVGGEELCGRPRTFVADANETNLIGYPSNPQKYKFNVQDNHEKNSRLGQSFNINEDNVSERKLAVNKSSSRPIKPRSGAAFGLNSTEQFNQDYTENEYRCSNRNFLVNGSDSRSTGYQPCFNQEQCTQPDNQSSDCSDNNFANNYRFTTTGSRPNLQSTFNTPKRLNREECPQVECSDRRYLVNNLNCNSPAYQPKTSSCRVNPTPVNQECPKSAHPAIYNRTSEAHRKSFAPVFTPLRNDSKYCMIQNIKQDEHNSRQSPSTKHGPPQCESGCLSHGKNETPIKTENRLSLPDIEEDWFNCKNWTVDEILKLDEEVTKSLWDAYNNQVRDLASDILKPFLSESTSAYLKDISDEQGDKESDMK